MSTAVLAAARPRVGIEPRPTPTRRTRPALVIAIVTLAAFIATGMPVLRTVTSHVAGQGQVRQLQPMLDAIEHRTAPVARPAPTTATPPPSAAAATSTS